MPNPFDNLGKKEDKPDPKWEEVEGRFGCFNGTCGKVTGTAFYNDEFEILRWTCPDKHENEKLYHLD